MTVLDAKHLRELKTESTRLKKLLAESILEIEGCEKSGDRIGTTTAGAVDDHPRIERTACVMRIAHKRQHPTATCRCANVLWPWAHRLVVTELG